MAYARTNEPVYSFILRKEIYSWFGLRYDEASAEGSIRKNLAVRLMNAQLSVELVYTILHTITQHTKGKKKPSFKDYQDYDFTNKNEFMITNMKIDDIDNIKITGDIEEEKAPSLYNKITRKMTKSSGSLHSARTNDDFVPAVQSIEVDSEQSDGNSSYQEVVSKPSIQKKTEAAIIDKDIICTEFAPDVFAYLREADGFTTDNLKTSLNPIHPENIRQIKEAGEGMGKSGSFFFFSHDTNFLIKTMTLGDFQAFKKLFKAYFTHINLYPNSFLARIYGVYSV